MDAILLGFLVLLAAAQSGGMVYFLTRPKDDGDDAQARVEQKLQAEALQRSLTALQTNISEMGGRLSQMENQRSAGENALKKTLDERLDAVNKRLGDSLAAQTKHTTETLNKNLTDLQSRMAVIDKAQANLTSLSSQVVDLQKVLDNKQARGAFGEIQLRNIVEAALPPNAYAFQQALEGGTRPDCTIFLPDPHPPIVIDSKFPLEAYNRYVEASEEAERKTALKRFTDDVSKHISDIADRYIVMGETADSALMFVPSEAVYAEIHASMTGLVEQGFRKRVWIVSPTTLMATLHTVRAVLRDAEMKKQAHLIQAEVQKLMDDMGRLDMRVKNLGRHFSQTSKDIDQIETSTGKILKTGERIANIELEDEADGDEKDLLD